MLDHVRRLLAHAAWADAEFLRAWADSPAREHDELRERVRHVQAIQRAFPSMLAGGPPVWPAAGPPPGFAELAAESRALHAHLHAFAAGLSEADLARAVRLPHFPDPPCVVTVGEGLVQMAMHTQHHRGQLMTRLRELGGRPRNVDWVIWLWQGRPAPVWP
jgi:uncharacterized damage-inducible protein DinB